VKEFSEESLPVRPGVPGTNGVPVMLRHLLYFTGSLFVSTVDEQRSRPRLLYRPFKRANRPIAILTIG
jgi:hypothetical protein